MIYQWHKWNEHYYTCTFRGVPSVLERKPGGWVLVWPDGNRVFWGTRAGAPAPTEAALRELQTAIPLDGHRNAILMEYPHLGALSQEELDRALDLAFGRVNERAVSAPVTLWAANYLMRLRAF